MFFLKKNINIFKNINGFPKTSMVSQKHINTFQKKYTLKNINALNINAFKNINALKKTLMLLKT